jgi:hippurate hydrolase
MKKINLLTFLIILTATVVAQPKKATSTNQLIGGVSVEQIKKLVDAESQYLTDIFKDFHANPELPFMETRTAGIVAKELKSYGFNVMTSIGITGVVGVFKNGEGPTVMYRADMDCNSVKEITGLPYASTKTMKNADGIEVPVMHACGHDAHTTWMLGVAKVMMQLKDKWKGTLVMVGQPAEENGFGADTMANEMYKKGVPVPDYLLGMHTAPVGLGLYLNRHGDRMAAAVQLDATFKGVGGHGSQPQDTKDPVVMAANAIIQYQTIISRNMDPQRPAVLTVGAVQAGIDNNVIPAEAVLKINLRSYQERDKEMMIAGIKRVNEGIAVANGLPKELYPELHIKQNLGVLSNNKELVDKIEPGLEKIAGPDKNLVFPPVMGSEDFQQLVKDHPSSKYAYVLLGIANQEVFQATVKKGGFFPFTNHNPDFQVDLAAIPFGAKMGVAMVLEAFKK